jgi:tRNA pseudouridine38-40 synthase
MAQIKLMIAYDGTSYKGWQKTRLGPSIESELGRALGRILQQPLLLEAASRTDAGVHADEQIVGLRLSEVRYPPERLVVSANSLLPPDIRIIEAEIVNEEFHATLSAKGKEYHYYFCLGSYQLPKWRHFSWHCHEKLDREEMERGARLLIGSYDFAALCNARKEQRYRTTVRTIDRVEFVDLPDGRLRLEMEGSAFLFRMARNIAGTLYAVGRGKFPATAIPEILRSGQRDQAGVTAPAHGLCLKKVNY